VKPASLIPKLQSDALAREIEQQLQDETAAVMNGAERDAKVLLAQARLAARARLHAAIVELRKEGARRRARAQAQRDTLARQRAQHQAALAVGDAMPLLREMLVERWRDPQARRQWTDALAKICKTRLRPGAWTVEHPRDWDETEQRDFATALGRGQDIDFKAADEIAAGLRIKSDQAVLDATPIGLLADRRSIAAMLLDEMRGQP
jgi:F0F1-type ATP synthase membrane subunit b/b'